MTEHTTVDPLVIPIWIKGASPLARRHPKRSSADHARFAREMMRKAGMRARKDGGWVSTDDLLAAYDRLRNQADRTS